MPPESPPVDECVDRLVATVRSWSGVRPTPHRFSGTAFLLGAREIGHVHRSGAVDVHFPHRVRELLRTVGPTAQRVDPESGWTTIRISSPGDVDDALGLLRVSYLYTASRLRHSPVGRDALRTVDLDDELTALDPGGDLRDAFDDAHV